MVNDNDIVQWAYLLDPAFQIVNTAGKPLTEGYIEVYYQGTRDKYYCANDFDGTLLPFQIPLDSLGSNIVLASPDNAYDIYIYNKFGSLIMSRYNVKPGHGAGGSGGLTTITITSSDGTVQIDRTGNTYDLSIQDTIDRIDELEEAIASVSGVTEYSVATGYGDGGTFVLTDKDTKDITYLNDMSGWRLQPGKVYQLNFNTKFTLDDQYNNLVEGKLYLDGDMSFSQDWSFTLDDSFDHIHHINGSTIIVVPDSLQYYDLALKYTFNSIVNCAVDLENISIVDITSIVKDPSAGEYTAGDGINITNQIISVDMDYINEQINIDEKLSSAVNIANDYTDNSINEVISTINNVSGDIINYVDNSIGDVVDVIASATATLEQEIQDIPPQVQSDWEQDDSTQVDYIKNKPDEIELIAGQNIGLFEGNGTLTISASATDLSDYATHSEIYSATTSAINSANSYTDNAISNIDFSDYSTHNEVYSATSTAIASANSYTDTAIANIDLTPAVEIVSPNNTISVSSVTDSVNNTKTFYIDTNSPDTNYWIGEANLSLSDQSSQGQVGYYKDVFDYTTKLNGNLDATKLKKGLYLLTANVMIVADEVNNDLAEIQIQSNSTSAISFTSSVFQHDCSVADTLGEPMDESHQIATIVRVVYDDTPMSLIARMDDPTTVSNELHLWFSDIGLYELNGTSIGGGSSPSASGSYDAGWGIVINGNVISVNPNIIPDISNLASTTYVDNRIASAVNIIESEIPDVSDMATQTWVNSQGFLTEIPSYYATDTEVNNAIATAINSIPAQVNADWNSTSGKSEILNKPDLSVYSTHAEVYNATVTAINVATANIPSHVQSDWTEDDSTDPSYIQNKPETIDVDVCPIIAGNGISITASGDSAVLSCTVTGSGGESYSAGNGIDITNNTISIDNTVALKSDIPDVTEFVTSTEVSAIVGSVSSIIENDIPDTSDMATKTWVTSQGYLTEVPSNYATDTEVANAIATAVSAIPSQVQSDWDEDDTTDPSYIQNKPEEINLVAGTNISITASGDNLVISSTASSVEPIEYTAGNGIDITNNTISIDNTVALKSEIPDVSSFVTSNEVSAIVGAATAELPTFEQVQSDWTEDDTTEPSYIQNKPETVDIDVCPIIAGANITITASGDSAVISSTGGGGSTYTAGTGIDITNDVISVDNTIATKTWVGQQGYLTSVPSQYITETELASELTDYALKTDIPDPVSGASGVKVEDSVVSLDNPVGLCAGDNITITVSGDSAIISGQAGGGSTYTEGTGIDITNDVISIDDSVVATKTWVGNQGYLTTVPSTYATDAEVSSAIATAIANVDTVSIDVCPILAGENVTITASGDSAVIDATIDTSTFATKTEVQTVSAAIPDTSDMATKTWVGNQGYLTSIPSTYATDTEVSNAIASATTGMVTYSGNTAINHIQLVSTLPASPDANTLYLIPEA
ncbi:hypothetical protein [Candidatus Ruminimicrobium bovinum]|uniref:hypothetical protein n=1 Tax=Candidatus Ruminimicrobium bovinum TaxID=3242779 RepID=UPI0039B83298